MKTQVSFDVCGWVCADVWVAGGENGTTAFFSKDTMISLVSYKKKIDF